MEYYNIIGYDKTGLTGTQTATIVAVNSLGAITEQHRSVISVNTVRLTYGKTS